MLKRWKIIAESRGRIQTHEIEALTQHDAQRAARKFGKVMSVKKVRGFRIEIPLEIQDRQVLLHRLAAMAAAKVGTGEALALIEDNFSGAIKRVSGRLLKQVEAGADLGQAMETIGAPNFPANVVALVRAGFRGGNSAAALRNAAEFEAEMQRIKKGNLGEIYAGLFGFLSAAAITFGTTRVMAPMMAESPLMKMAGEDASNPIFSVLASISEITMGIMTLIFLALLALSTVGRWINAVWADRLILRIPFYKDLVLSRNNYTTLYSLSLLVHSGVPMEHALQLSSESAPPGGMRDDLQNAVAAVKKGRPWAKAMRNLEPTDKAALAGAMDRESIAVILDALSHQYRQLYASRIATLAPMLKGVAALFLVMSGAVLFGLTIMPVLKMAADGF